MRPLIATTFAALLAVSLPARAACPNGGTTTVVDGHPIEFVSSDTDLTFFISDEDGRPVDTAGLTAKAFVLRSGKTETVTLKGAEPNKLIGPLTAPLAAGAKVTLSAKLHGHNLQARFEK
ncbi:hypothetical protein ASG60_19430 [Methylobacterium sp. Leaf469]|uniref:hypothetical protein n=1 Tax=Methylobacterium sp. Leaf469 TaxID=1736387 RepID=UPI0006F4C44E|nr:hypothetical protein [Methylobacterium sp. Leaf469]KQU00806.1 hypothetical protein ASG60_19430 [Methylobacterium sp. Leaf469]